MALSFKKSQSMGRTPEGQLQLVKYHNKGTGNIFHTQDNEE